MQDASGRNRALDGLRGAACLAVLVTHVLPGTFTPFVTSAVDIFFVLSGFLITKLLLEERERFGRVDVLRFYARRAIRLVPAMYLTVALVVLAGLISRRRTVPVVLNLGNWWRAFEWDPLGPLGHTWSLAIEQQFYLVWPLVLVLGWRWWRVRGVAVLAGVAYVAGFAARQFAVGGERLVNGTDTHADGLLLGALLACAVQSKRWWPQVVRLGVPRVASWVAWVAFTLLAVLGAAPLSPSVSIPLLSALSVMLVGAIVVQPTMSLGRVLAVRPLRRVGRISYGLYLSHFPIMAMLRPVVSTWAVALLTVPLSLVAGALSSALVERPIARRLRPYVRPRGQVAARRGAVAG